MLAELGRMLAPEFRDGVAFVALANVDDPSDLLPTLAAALDVKEAEGRTLGEGVITPIGDRQALLLLDNLEQVAAAAPDLASLVERCPALRIVTTSRTPLRALGFVVPEHTARARIGGRPLCGLVGSRELIVRQPGAHRVAVVVGC